VRIETAVGADPADLCDALNDAYSDYPVPFSLTPAQLSFLLRSRGFAPELSALAYDETGAIAALWLTGRPRGDRAYVIAVGVRRAHLRRGLARALFDAALPWLRARGVASLSLEVIEQNHAARTLYRSLGFAEMRRLACLRATAMGLEPSQHWSPEHASLTALDELARRERDWRPSWQNETESLREIAEDVDVEAVFADGACIGAGAFIIPTRSVAQIVVARGRRRRGVGKALLAAWAARHGEGAMSMINVDAEAGATLAFLRAHGFADTVGQVDMRLVLSA
jgi:ribosomal protein S18 acetylase RimI-like enzyme